MALIFGSLFFVLDWIGYRGKFQALGPPRDLFRIWWHLPIFILVLFIAMMFCLADLTIGTTFNEVLTEFTQVQSRVD